MSSDVLKYHIWLRIDIGPSCYSCMWHQQVQQGWKQYIHLLFYSVMFDFL
jgi:hypothetical protein